MRCGASFVMSWQLGLGALDCLQVSSWLTLSALFLLLFEESGKTVAPVIATPQGISVTLDIAALIWPLVVLIVCLAYRDRVPNMIRGLLGRIAKFEVAGISFELAKATSFAPDWNAGVLDLRRSATAVQVNDSTTSNFQMQLKRD